MELNHRPARSLTFLSGRNRNTMKKITVAVHERTYHQARVWSPKHDTSLAAVEKKRDFKAVTPYLTSAISITYPTRSYRNTENITPK